MIKKLFILVGLARAGGVCAGKISPNARFLHARYPRSTRGGSVAIFAADDGPPPYRGSLRLGA